MKYLMQKGFVDKEGYIMYDKEYRRSLGPLNKVKCETKKNNKDNKNNNNNLSRVIFDLSIKNNNNNYVLPPIFRTKDRLPI